MKHAEGATLCGRNEERTLNGIEEGENFLAGRPFIYAWYFSLWYYGKSHQAGIEGGDPRLGASLKQLSAATNSPTLYACPDTTRTAVVLAELAKRRHSTRSRWIKGKSRDARRA